MFKSTGDTVRGRQLFEHYSTVEEGGGGGGGGGGEGGGWQWLALREIVMARKLPRAMYVQPLTTIDAGEGH